MIKPKRTPIIQILFFLSIQCMFSMHASAQSFSNKQLREWSRNPEWVKMLDDPNANYFEVIAAYEAFWKDRKMPVEEDQILSMPRDERERTYSKSEMRKRKRQERDMEKEEREEAVIRHQFAFDVKRYKHWKLTVEPYVQSDGSILSKEEQLNLHQTQRP